MRILHWPKLQSWSRFWTAPPPDPVHQTARIRFMEVYIGLPVKAVVVALVFYYLFFSNWFEEGTTAEIPPGELALAVIRYFFLIYVVLNTAGGSLLLGMRQLPFEWIERVVFNISWVDALFLTALTAVTDGYHSILFWVFPGLIIRNAVSVSTAGRQIFLNSFVTVCYLLAGFLNTSLNRWQLELLDDKVREAFDQTSTEYSAESVLLRFSLLALVTICSCGLQVLYDRQRRAEDEAREYGRRRDQLQAAGRLAAEIAHQLKNPLGIINNASFTLQRTLKEGKKITQQIKIIREEVERSDRILTELMGYAQLSEGKVEKLDVLEELDRAIQSVFPSVANYPVQIERDYGVALPYLLMQRAHISEVFVNLLQNAREAMNGNGKITVSAKYGGDYSVMVSIADNGPGIPADKVERVFEPYFTTKPKGTGLGLAIVKHNTELYGGTVQIESAVGKGTTFTLTLPARITMKLRK